MSYDFGFGLDPYQDESFLDNDAHDFFTDLFERRIGVLEPYLDDFEFLFEERGMDVDIDSMPRHSSSGAREDSVSVFGGEVKLIAYRLNTRAARNKREWEGRSMSFRKWKRRLGPRRNRRRHRDSDGEQLNEHIFWARELIKAEREQRSISWS